MIQKYFSPKLIPSQIKPLPLYLFLLTTTYMLVTVDDLCIYFITTFLELQILLYYFLLTPQLQDSLFS